MARLIKLPPELRDWKVDSLVKSEGESEIYKVVKEDADGETTNAVLRVISMNKDDYSTDRAAFFEEEADFVASLEGLDDTSVYLDVYVQNNPSKQSSSLYVFTEDLKDLETVMKQKEFSEDEIVDFGIKMSTVLEKLESENIFHGNISPKNIYVTPDGNYKLGGFSDLESKIEGSSFMSPEVYKHEQADFTTDIYSLGMIMYAMSNNGKLPFEGDGVNRNAANDKRLSGASVPAPANGSEKLKSVVVIACQANNSVRWKNAGNIKNALTSIQSELAQNKNNSPTPLSADGAADDSDNGNDDGSKIKKAAIVGVGAAAAGTAAVSAVKDSKVEAAENELSGGGSESYTSDSPIESTDVFDEYSVGENHGNFAEKKKFAAQAQKDYGNYFEDEEEVPVETKSSAAPSSKDAGGRKNLDVTDFDKNAFAILETEENSGGKHAQKKGKGKVIAVIALCTVILAAAGVVGYVVYNNMSNSSDKSSGGSTADTAVSATVETGASTSSSSTESTTAQETTSSASSQSSSSESSSGSSSSESSGTASGSSASGSSASSDGTTVTSVLGYTYENAKQTLEAQGFNVEIWTYQYSKYYTEGYVMSQTPEGGVSASNGSTVYLMISKGLSSQQSSSSDSQSSSSSSNSQNSSSSSGSSGNSSTSGDYLFSNSASSYLSSAQVESLTDTELQLAINEIYARRGRIFNDSSINAYFNQKSWYEGKYTADEFSSNVTFNEYEQKNLQLLISERDSRG